MSAGRIAAAGFAGPSRLWAKLGAWPRPRGLCWGRIYLRSPRRRDWLGWAVVRAASRDFLRPWESTWPADALSRGAFRARRHEAARQRRAGTGYHFLVFRAADGALLGGISLVNVRRGIIQAGMLGYWIGENFARRGYMTEAVQATLRFALEELGLNRVEAACLPENAASRALLARCGFIEEGLARQLLRINGAWRDHVTFGVLREDWRRGLRQARRAPDETAARGDGSGGR